MTLSTDARIYQEAAAVARLREDSLGIGQINAVLPDTLRERLAAMTGERIAALEAVKPAQAPSGARGKEAERGHVRISDRVAHEKPIREMQREKTREASGLEQ